MGRMMCRQIQRLSQKRRRVIQVHQRQVYHRRIHPSSCQCAFPTAGKKSKKKVKEPCKCKACTLRRQQEAVHESRALPNIPDEAPTTTNHNHSSRLTNADTPHALAKAPSPKVVRRKLSKSSSSTEDSSNTENKPHTNKTVETRKAASPLKTRKSNAASRTDRPPPLSDRKCKPKSKSMKERGGSVSPQLRRQGSLRGSKKGPKKKASMDSGGLEREKPLDADSLRSTGVIPTLPTPFASLPSTPQSVRNTKTLTPRQLADFQCRPPSRRQITPPLLKQHRRLDSASSLESFLFVEDLQGIPTLHYLLSKGGTDSSFQTLRRSRKLHAAALFSTAPRPA